MPIRDSWHKTMVYFGLADEPDDYDYDSRGAEPEAVLEDRYRERPNVRRLQGRRRRDDFDDIFSDESEERSGRSRPIQLRSVPGGRAAAASRGSAGAGNEFGVHLVIPKSFNDAQQVADKFKEGIPVILNMEGIETQLVARMIDFASGLTYGLEGGMQRIANKVFMLTPRDVELSAEERARLIEKGFFNQA